MRSNRLAAPASVPAAARGAASFRLWEMDALRGVAILMMVLYHLLFDLSALGGFPIDVFTGFWRLEARATASLFITLAGRLPHPQLCAGAGPRRARAPASSPSSCAAASPSSARACWSPPAPGCSTPTRW